ILDRVRGQSRLPDELDAGYRLLVDKDGRTDGFAEPTYTAYIPQKPTEVEFLALVEEFWWETTYVAKNLWRVEIFNARYSVEVVMRFELLRPMLEWYIETLHDWSLRPGVLGKGFKKLFRQMTHSGPSPAGTLPSPSPLYPRRPRAPACG